MATESTTTPSKEKEVAEKVTISVEEFDSMKEQIAELMKAVKESKPKPATKRRKIQQDG